MKTKLIGSAPSLERMKLMLENYFYSAITFEEKAPTTWSIHNSKGAIAGCRVRLVKDRYRFEMEVL
jgi:hypothetical protein